mmetsp:Transcript_45304/g.126033  ORF Transcript_45304/g.126033 Transcript_45304/m.126033 type:complete len:329 (+) Transcript_45304:192-1178(+)
MRCDGRRKLPALLRCVRACQGLCLQRGRPPLCFGHLLAAGTLDPDDCVACDAAYPLVRPRLGGGCRGGHPSGVHHPGQCGGVLGPNILGALRGPGGVTFLRQAAVRDHGALLALQLPGREDVAGAAGARDLEDGTGPEGRGRVRPPSSIRRRGTLIALAAHNHDLGPGLRELAPGAPAAAARDAERDGQAGAVACGRGGAAGGPRGRLGHGWLRSGPRRQLPRHASGNKGAEEGRHHEAPGIRGQRAADHAEVAAPQLGALPRSLHGLCAERLGAGAGARGRREHGLLRARPARGRRARRRTHPLPGPAGRRLGVALPALAAALRSAR